MSVRHTGENLLRAAKSGDTDAVREALEAKVDPNFQNQVSQAAARTNPNDLPLRPAALLCK